MGRRVGCLTAALAASLALAACAQRAEETAGPRRVGAPPTLRLYVLDCGTLHVPDTSRFDLRPEEVATRDLAVPCFLVAHPDGTLIWDVGAVPDAEWQATGAPVEHHLMLPEGQERDLTLTRPLLEQLAAAGYAAAAIDYLALSHYHYDHTANANAFAGAEWLVRREERAAMFAEKPPFLTRPASYAALRSARTRIVEGENHDVFGDGTVVVKAALGHTPGHQVLYLRLAETGGVVLSGDLYHYPEERTLDRVPTFEADPQATRASRVALEAFLAETGARLWIQHDLRAHAALRKAPNYYE